MGIGREWAGSLMDLVSEKICQSDRKSLMNIEEKEHQLSVFVQTHTYEHEHTETHTHRHTHIYMRANSHITSIYKTVDIKCNKTLKKAKCQNRVSQSGPYRPPGVNKILPG